MTNRKILLEAATCSDAEVRRSAFLALRLSNDSELIEQLPALIEKEKDANVKFVAEKTLEECRKAIKK